MSAWTVRTAAAELLAAERVRTDRKPLTDEWPGLDVETAYRIQDEALAARLRAGERVIGVKLGLTSRAKQRQMNVDSPTTGWLTDAMLLPPGRPVPQHELIHPRIEPEIVLVLGTALKGPGHTAASVLNAVDRVYGGIEIIDSRFADFRFTLADVIADNSSAARFVLGPLALGPGRLDLSLEACLLEVDGQVVDSATGAAVQGHPLQTLALAANSLAARGHHLPAGSIVLSGGMTSAVPMPPGTSAAVHFTHLGSIPLSGG